MIGMRLLRTKTKNWSVS